MKKAPKMRVASVVAVVLVAGIAFSGCATDRRTTGSIASPGKKEISSMTVPELKRAVSHYGNLYEKNPKDKGVGMAYAKVLQMTGNSSQSLSVMQQVVIEHPEDNQVLGEYGKALAANGDLDKALKVIQRANRPDHPDWKLLSAQGAILDQLGRPNEARKQYRKAADIAPNEPSVISNLGMSYMLEGDLRSAETYLSKANKMPGADSRVRQNLALAVGLQGRFDEAKQIASAELPPAQAQENINYLQKMLSQQNSWKQLKKEG